MQHIASVTPHVVVSTWYILMLFRRAHLCHALLHLMPLRSALLHLTRLAVLPYISLLISVIFYIMLILPHTRLHQSR